MKHIREFESFVPQKEDTDILSDLFQEYVDKYGMVRMPMGDASYEPTVPSYRILKFNRTFEIQVYCKHDITNIYNDLKNYTSRLEKFGYTISTFTNVKKMYVPNIHFGQRTIYFIQIKITKNETHKRV